MTRTKQSLLTGLLCLVTLGCAPDAGPVETFDAVWEDFDAMYGGFEMRNLDWDDVYDRHRPRVSDDTTDDELFAVLTDMLAETDDGHVQITRPGHVHWHANHIRRELIGDERFDRALVEQVYLGGEYEGGGKDAPTIGTLPTGHPYVHLPGIDELTLRLDDVRPAAEATGGLVLDMRHNGGGDGTYALALVDRWSSTKKEFLRTRTRDGLAREDFSAWHTWSVASTGREIDFPIVVLIDRFTISAGERLVLALAAFDDVTFLGETTNGAFATCIGRDMLNGWTYKLPTQEVLAMDGTTPEVAGVAPDEEILNDPAEMEQGTDAVLDRAMAILQGG